MTLDPALSAATLAIHGRRARDTHADSILFPIYQTATYVHETVGVTKGFSYSRGANPTVDALEQAISSLEETPGAVCFRTGMAAISTLLLAVLKAGDHVVVSDVIYGGTIRLFDKVLGGLGIESSFIDCSNLNAIEDAIRPNTRMLLIETPANPTLKLIDIAAVAGIAKRHKVLLAVDNTFLTPLLQRPLDMGADISILSTTKYVDGHNATIGGSVATHDEALLEHLRLIRKTLGTIQAPMEAWLTLQGSKTLPARMKLHCENARCVARWLESNPAVERVHYPGLDSFPQRKLAEKQQRDGGGMLAFELKGVSREQTMRVIDALKLCSCAESLGSLETLVTHPATASHCDVPAEIRERLGVTDRLIRMSVGLEAPEDIIADLDQAIASVFEGAVTGGAQ